MLNCEDIIEKSYGGNERILKDNQRYVVILNGELRYAIREDGPFDDNGWTAVYASIINSVNNDELTCII